MPSRRTQISAIARVLTPPASKPGALSAARSQNSRPASQRRSSSSVRSSLGSGSDSDGTRQASSPGMWSGSRLVASTVRSGHERSSSSARRAHESIRCSQLSSTSKSRRGASCIARAVAPGCPARSWRPSASATASGTSDWSASGARSTSQTPSGKPRSLPDAASMASRVLPHPPGPVSVTSRLRSSRRHTSVSSRSRPTKLVSLRGRLCGPRPGSASRRARCSSGGSPSTAAKLPLRIDWYSARVSASGTSSNSRRSAWRSCWYWASACWRRPLSANAVISCR